MRILILRNRPNLKINLDAFALIVTHVETPTDKATLNSIGIAEILLKNKAFTSA